MESNDPRWPSLDQQDTARIDELINKEQTLFPIELLPTECHNYIKDLSTSLGLDYNICSVGAFSALANAIGLKASIKTEYTNSPIIWISVVAGSGYGKTPALDKVIFPLSELDYKSAVSYSRAQEAYQLDKQGSQKPKLQQRLVSNFTIESLIDVHKQNPNGLLIYVDELMGFINSFGQYKSGKSGEQEQYLSMHDGKSVCVNRKTQDPIVIEKTCVSILGGMQPSKLFQFLGDGRADDGFLYRFLFVFATEKKVEDDSVNEENELAKHQYNQLVTRLAEKNFKVQYQLDEKGKQILRYWKKRCDELFGEDEFDNAYQKKLIKMVLRFALISHCSREINHDHPGKIQASSVLNAIKTAEFFRANLNNLMEHFYDSDQYITESRLKEILKKIPNGQIQRKDIIPYFVKHGISERAANDHLKRGKHFKKISHGIYELRIKK
jgi:hypothetical protein